MPRIRSIKPEIFVSPQVMNLSLGARLLFIGLITQADDEGRGVADPRKLKSAVFAGDEEVNSEAILSFLEEVRRERLCTLYPSQDHGEVYALPSWNDHQKVEKPRKSSYPKPPRTFREESGNDLGHIREESGTIPRGSDLIGEDQNGSDRRGSDRRGSEGSKSRTTSVPPSESPTPETHRRAPNPPPKRVNKNGRAEEPEAARIEKALQLMAADPTCKIGDAARLLHVSVEAIEQAKRA